MHQLAAPCEPLSDDIERQCVKRTDVGPPCALSASVIVGHPALYMLGDSKFSMLFDAGLQQTKESSRWEGKDGALAHT